MPRRSIVSEDDETEINLSPMIDCIFILLIFFIVTTVFVEETGLQVDKPDAAAAPTENENESLVLEITSENEILFGDVPINLSEVTGRVQAARDGGTTAISIHAHVDSQHGTFMSVWDAAKRAGADALSFSTVN